MKMLQMFLLLVLVGASSAKVFERCEWARLLKSYGMDGYQGYSLPNWVCLSEWESHYNTQATNHNTDGSTDYGIFQLNSRFWCEDYQTPGSVNACGIECRDVLTDDVSAAIHCAQRVVEDPNGMAAWVAWRRHCEGQDLSSYVAGCGV